MKLVEAVGALISKKLSGKAGFPTMAGFFNLK
jgi:hypothetical protein